MQVNLTLASSMNTCSCIIKLKTVCIQGNISPQFIFPFFSLLSASEFHCFILLPLQHNCVLGEFMI